MKSKFGLRSAMSFLIVAVSLRPHLQVLAQEARGRRTMMKKQRPSSKPSSKPSGRPSGNPSRAPSAPPSVEPSVSPSASAPPSVEPSVSPSTMPSQQCHPLDTLYDNFIPSVQQCEGVDLSPAQEAYLSSQVSNLVDNLSNCIDKEKGLNDAINSGQELILLCPHTSITLETSITSISNKQFEMRCLSAPSEGEPSCVISGNNTFKLFSSDIGGQNVNFYGIRFTGGTADFRGGFAFLGGGGRAEFDSCQFDKMAGGFGGAIYIGSGAVVVVMNSVFKKNSASLGGAMYVEEGSQLIVGSTSFSENSASGQGPNIRAQTSDAVRCSFGNTFPAGEIQIANAVSDGALSCTF